MTRTTLGMAVAAAVACLAAGPAAAAVDFSTLIQWKVEAGGNGHYYALTDTASSWTSAHAAATAAGGNLASIGSATENAFVGVAFGFSNDPSSIYWIGLRRETAGGAFSWTDGSSLNYTNWHPGEPNNAGAGEDYVALNWYGGNVLGSVRGTWNDTPNNGTLFGNPMSQPYRGVVEFATNPVAAVPEPAAWALMIGGFGLAGATLRRRRTLATA